MSIGAPEAVSKQAEQAAAVRVNDVTIEVATVNGTGSQTANHVLARTFFQLGIPVGAKNLFPSNIAGMPTWYTIRANKNGWRARVAQADIVVLMNPESLAEDLARTKSGAIVIVRDDLADQVQREDIRLIVVPFNQMVAPLTESIRTRKYIVNLAYVGVLCYLLQVDMAELKTALAKQFDYKEKVVEINQQAAEAGYTWAKENLEPLEGFRIERMGTSEGKILIDGNTAGALGAVWGGVTVVGWYPITPSSTWTEGMIDYLEQIRIDPATGKRTFAVVQAEDELAAMGIIVGGGWAGARTFTTTSGPGMSLMAELAGLSYFAEIPCVIASVQRVGPSTGLPTRTCQGDIAKAYYLSHGDAKHILLLPATPKEIFDFTVESFDFAERFQTLVFVMTDLDQGMNLWDSPEFEQPTKPQDRGKVLSAEDLDKIQEFARYRDVDGDGIPFRTLPGTNHPKAAYFTRGTGHNDAAKYCEKPAIWAGNLDRLVRKFETAAKELPAPIIETCEGARVGVLAYGSSDQACGEARFLLGEQHGLKAAYLRLRALPVHPEAWAWMESLDRIYVVDQNRDAQVASILRAERPELAGKIRSVRHYDGTTLDAQTVVDQIMAQEAGR